MKREIKKRPTQPRGNTSRAYCLGENSCLHESNKLILIPCTKIRKGYYFKQANRKQVEKNGRKWMLDAVKSRIKRTREHILREKREPCVSCGTTDPEKFSARIMQSSMCVMCNRSPNDNVRNKRLALEGVWATKLFSSGADPRWAHKELIRLGEYVPEYFAK